MIKQIDPALYRRKNGKNRMNATLDEWRLNCLDYLGSIFSPEEYYSLLPLIARYRLFDFGKVATCTRETAVDVV